MQCGSGVDLSDVGRVNREPRRIVMFVLMFNPEKKNCCCSRAFRSAAALMCDALVNCADELLLRNLRLQDSCGCWLLVGVAYCLAR